MFFQLKNTWRNASFFYNPTLYDFANTLSCLLLIEFTIRPVTLPLHFYFIYVEHWFLYSWFVDFLPAVKMNTSFFIEFPLHIFSSIIFQANGFFVPVSFMFELTSSFANQDLRAY